ncbi:hypothetical protein C8Q73DRAFT_698446 [Cubamyces lactineus]|nr:hypothetical protein C8Q73DRAFT_698446 [Cubamyces lactineus]
MGACGHNSKPTTFALIRALLRLESTGYSSTVLESVEAPMRPKTPASKFPDKPNKPNFVGIGHRRPHASSSSDIIRPEPSGQ